GIDMVVAIELGTDAQGLCGVVPELGFGKKEALFAFFAGGRFIAVVAVLGPDGEVAGEFQLIVKKTAVPIECEDRVVGWFGVGDVFVVEDGGQERVLPAEWDFGAGLISVCNIVAVL